MDIASHIHIFHVQIDEQLVGQIDNFLRPLAKVHPVICQRNIPVATHEKRSAKLLFQLLHLFRQRRLGNVQTVGRLC